jgi:hypothetical protein
MGIKWPGREDDHSPPSTAEVKNALSYTSTPQYVLSLLLSCEKHRDNFTFSGDPYSSLLGQLVSFLELLIISL